MTGVCLGARNTVARQEYRPVRLGGQLYGAVFLCFLPVLCSNYFNIYGWSLETAHLHNANTCGGGIMFSGCPSVHRCMRNTSLLIRLQLIGWTDFYQTLQKCSVPSVDELIRLDQGSSQRWPSCFHLFVCLQHKFVSAISSVWVVVSSPQLHWKVTTILYLACKRYSVFWS